MASGPGFALCGPEQGKIHKYRCPCCKMESDDPESIAVVLCWACIFGSPHCIRCRENGIAVTEFGERAWMFHYLSVQDPEITRCGRVLTVDQQTGAGDTPRPCPVCVGLSDWAYIRLELGRNWRDLRWWGERIVRRIKRKLA